LQGVVVHETLFPQGHKDIGRHPLLEPAMGGAAGANPRGVQRIPLATRPEDKEDGIHRPAILDAGPMTPQGV